jgi:hypothetical protein
VKELPAELQEKWDEAARTGQPVEVGRLVVCDSCSKDLTESPESGGFVFGSYGYGPCCAERFLAEIRRYGEEEFIKAHCPPGMSFADFIRAYRGPASCIRIGELGKVP